MSVKNVTVIDLALCELCDGKTAAPKDVLDELRARGLVAVAGGKASLTPKGRRRAEALKAAEHDLRRMFAGAAASGGAALHTDARCGLHVGGGRAHFRA